MDPITNARELATAHPQARLPCPACGTTVRADNLDRHLAKVHPGATAPGSPWRGRGLLGIAPCRIELDGDALVLHHWLGLGRRAVGLPCAIEVGTLVGTRVDPVTASYADDSNQPGQTVRVGRYLRLIEQRGGRGARAITIGCRQDTGFQAHWGLRDGDRRRRWDLILPRTSLVAIEYELARRGVLVPAVSHRD